MAKMNKKEMSEILVILRIMREFYGLKPLLEQAENLYFEAIKDLPFHAVKKAMEVALKTRQFFPAPAVIRELAAWSEPQACQTPQDLAKEAAEAAAVKVRTAIADYGPYLTVVFDDPLIHEVLYRMFGGRNCWVLICDHDEREMKWTMKEFREKYADLWVRVRTGSRDQTSGGYPALRNTPKRLMGIFEVNGSSTPESTAPRYVGDVKAAIAWSGEKRLLESGKPAQQDLNGRGKAVEEEATPEYVRDIIKNLFPAKKEEKPAPRVFRIKKRNPDPSADPNSENSEK